MACPKSNTQYPMANRNIDYMCTHKQIIDCTNSTQLPPYYQNQFFALFFFSVIFLCTARQFYIFNSMGNTTLQQHDSHALVPCALASKFIVFSSCKWILFFILPLFLVFFTFLFFIFSLRSFWLILFSWACIRMLPKAVVAVVSVFFSLRFIFYHFVILSLLLRFKRLCAHYSVNAANKLEKIKIKKK